MDKTKIVKKIEKLLRLAQNNPSEEEAKSAALKAQKLMMEYHVQVGNDFETQDDQVYMFNVYMGEGHQWKIPLANIIANNFRCECALSTYEYISFYGFDVDVKIAGETFKTVFTIAERLLEKYKKSQRETYILGFLDGIRSALSQGSTELMVVTPQKVLEVFNKMNPDEQVEEKLDFENGDAYEEGRRDGKDAIQSRKLETTD